MLDFYLGGLYLRFTIDIEHKKVWLFFLFLKFLYMMMALFLYPKLSSLGDTLRYLNGPNAYAPYFLFNSTAFMDTIAYTFSVFLGTILANVPFLLISFYGVFYPINKLNLNLKQLVFVLFLLSLPSFGIWTSVASKESVSVFFMGVILGFFIGYVKGERRDNFWTLIFSVYLCAIFKPQYLVAVIFGFSFFYICKKISKDGYSSLIILFFSFFVSVLALYFFRNEINDLSFIMPKHFSLDAGSTRENKIWVNDFDVFINAPYGMMIAFIGPTVSEALSSKVHAFVFLESIFIVFSFFCLLFMIFTYSKRSQKFNVLCFGGFFLFLFWLLFVHYPFGVLNPGSAVRYRESFYSFILIFMFFWYSESYKSYFFKNKNGA